MLLKSNDMFRLLFDQGHRQQMGRVAGDATVQSLPRLLQDVQDAAKILCTSNICMWFEGKFDRALRWLCFWGS